MADKHVLTDDDTRSPGELLTVCASRWTGDAVGCGHDVGATAAAFPAIILQHPYPPQDTVRFWTATRAPALVQATTTLPALRLPLWWPERSVPALVCYYHDVDH